MFAKEPERSGSPEDELLRQFQGMIAEYERAVSHDPRAEELSDQPQHALVGHPAAQLGQQQSLVDAAKTILDVSFYRPLV